MAANNTLAPYGIGPQGQSSGNMFTKALGGFNEIMQDPNILKLLAQTGAGLDPQGTGGAVGNATIGMIETKAQQNNMQALIKALGANGKINVKPDGSIGLQIGDTSNQNSEQGTQQQSGLGTLEQGSQIGDNSTQLLDDTIDQLFNNLFSGGL